MLPMNDRSAEEMGYYNMHPRNLALELRSRWSVKYLPLVI